MAKVTGRNGLTNQLRGSTACGDNVAAPTGKRSDGMNVSRPFGEGQHDCCPDTGLRPQGRATTAAFNPPDYREPQAESVAAHRFWHEALALVGDHHHDLVGIVIDEDIGSRRLRVNQYVLQNRTNRTEGRSSRLRIH